MLEPRGRDVRTPWLDATLRLQLPFVLKVELQMEAEEVEASVERRDDQPLAETYFLHISLRLRPTHLSNPSWTPHA